MRLPILFITVMTFILSTTLSAQTYDWEWAERGGGKKNIAGGGSVPYYRSYEHIRDVVIDSNNNYYYLAQIGNDQTTYGSVPITTYDDGNSERDVYLFSTDEQGNFRFDKVIGGGLISDFPGSLAIDNQDNIYVTGSAPASVQATDTPVHFDNDTIMNIGSFDNPLPANKNLYTVKYDSNGNFEWLRQPQSPNLTWDEATIGLHYDMDVAADGTIHWFCKIGPGSHLDGNLVVPDSNTQGQAVIIRYDTNGNYLSHILLDFELDGFNFFNVSMDYDPVNDRYYLAAHRFNSTGSISFNGVAGTTTFLLALDNSGNLLWRKDNVSNDGTPPSMLITDVQIDGQGDVYLTGKVNSGNTTNNSNDGESFAGYTFDQALNSGLGATGVFLIKLNDQGNLLWGNNTDTFSFYPGRSISFYNNEVALGLGLDNGTTWDGFSVGGSGYEASLVRFNKNTGAVIALEKLSSGSGNAEITALEADQQGNYVVGGFTESSLFVDNTNIPTLTKTGGEADFFTAKYACQGCSIGTEQPEDNKAIILYPNPAQSYFKLVSRHQLNRYRIYDMQGKKVQQGKLTESKQTNSISDLAQGVYFVKVSDRHQQQQVLRLVVE